jgi:hypothetical protein
VVIRYTVRDDIHAAWSYGEIVILDVLRDRYFGLGQNASRTFASIASGERPDDDAVVAQLLASDLIVPTPDGEIRSVRITSAPEFGGLPVCEWRPGEGLIARPVGVIAAAVTVAGLDRVLRTLKLRGLIRALQNLNLRPASAVDDAILGGINSAVIVVRRWYPRRVDCLLGSAVTWSLLIRHGVAAELHIGVQKYPLYAHAWVEHQGRVVNDDSIVSRRLPRVLTLRPK